MTTNHYLDFPIVSRPNALVLLMSCPWMIYSGFCDAPERGEDSQPQQFFVRATSESSSSWLTAAHAHKSLIRFKVDCLTLVIFLDLKTQI